MSSRFLPTHRASSYNWSFCLTDLFPSFCIWRFIFDHNHIIGCLTSEIIIVIIIIYLLDSRYLYLGNIIVNHILDYKIKIFITHSRTAPITSPSGSIPGRSLRLWTTMSTSPTIKASSNAYEKEGEVICGYTIVCIYNLQLIELDLFM